MTHATSHDEPQVDIVANAAPDSLVLQVKQNLTRPSEYDLLEERLQPHLARGLRVTHLTSVIADQTLLITTVILRRSRAGLDRRTVMAVQRRAREHVWQFMMNHLTPKTGTHSGTRTTFAQYLRWSDAHGIASEERVELEDFVELIVEAGYTVKMPPDNISYIESVVVRPEY